jgi:hypothetical protein
LNDGNVLCSPDCNGTWQLDALIDWEGAVVGRAWQGLGAWQTAVKDLTFSLPADKIHTRYTMDVLEFWRILEILQPSSIISIFFRQLMRVSHMRRASRGKACGLWPRLGVRFQQLD